DLVRAFRALAPRDDATRRAIADALGYELRAAERAHKSGSRRTQHEPASRPDARDISPVRDDNFAEPPRPVARERSFQLRHPEPDQTTFAVPAIPSVRAVALPPPEDERPLPRPRLQTLSHPLRTRALVSTMAKKRAPAGPPELSRMVALAA